MIWRGIKSLSVRVIVRSAQRPTDHCVDAELLTFFDVVLISKKNVFDAFSGLSWLWMAPVTFVAACLVLAAIAFAFLYFMCQRVDLDKEEENDSPFYRAIARLYIEAILQLVQARVHTQGLEQTPKEGRFMLVCNHLIRFFQTDESPRHKAMFLGSAEWLIRTGKQTNNDRAVSKGMEALAKVYKDFDEERDATDEMPDMSRIAITQDVSIVKRDRVNYTEEEKLRMARKYGLTTKDLQEIEDEEMFSDKREEEPDYFEYMEKKGEEDALGRGNNELGELTNLEETEDEE